MLPRENRLRKTSEFKRVRDESSAHAHPLMVLWAAPNSSPAIRFGFSIGRALGGAAARNRERRRMRAAAGALLSRLGGGHDVVVTLRPAAREADFQALQEGLRAVCRRAGLLNEEAPGRATVGRGQGSGGQS